MLYIKYIFFCIKVLINLHHFKHFAEYDGSRGKNYRLELKQVDQKIKNASRKNMVPKQEHLFLSIFYECMMTDDKLEKRKEFVSLFCLLFVWWSSIDTSTEEE